jgi:hypothetical protein
MNDAVDGLLRKTGTILIVLGVCVWVVYAVMRTILEMNVSSGVFLVFHLAGVVPGSLLRRHRSIYKYYNRYVKRVG